MFHNYEKGEIHEIKIPFYGVYLPLSPNVQIASVWNLVSLRLLTVFPVLVS
jgi:hypothetical protein